MEAVRAHPPRGRVQARRRAPARDPAAWPAALERIAADRRLDWDACLNVRDLGGLPTATGPTKRGALVRGSALGALSPAGLDAMRRHGIRSVIDIRGPDEIAERASPYAAAATHHHAHFVLGGTMRIDQAATAGTMAGELARLAGPASGLADVIQAIARAEPGVMVHCVAGRDRTGFIVAVVLSAIGVGDEDVVADYVASDAELETEYRRYIAEHPDDEVNIRAAIARRAATMRSVLAAMRDGYGDAVGYLGAAGVADADIDRLRAKILA